MDNPQQLDQLVNVIIIFIIIFGSFFGLIFLYACGWFIIGVSRLYKHFLAFIAKKKNDPDRVILSVDKLLRQQHTDYILNELAK